jgi:hypothetical protein
MRAGGVKLYSAALWKFRLAPVAEARFKPWRGEAGQVAQPPPWRFTGRRSDQNISAVSMTVTAVQGHATSHAVADTAHPRADQINVRVSRACRQASVQSAPLVSRRQPEPFLTCGLMTAEPHIRSPLIAAGTKIPHTRGHRARKSGTNLYHGISQPGRYAVRSPRSSKGQLPSRMARFSFDVARWIRPLSTQPPPALLLESRSARERSAVCGPARQS